MDGEITFFNWIEPLSVFNLCSKSKREEASWHQWIWSLPLLREGKEVLAGRELLGVWKHVKYKVMGRWACVTRQSVWCSHLVLPWTMMSWICYKSLIVAAPGFGLLALMAVGTLPGSASWLFKPKCGWEVAGSGENWSDCCCTSRVGQHSISEWKSRSSEGRATLGILLWYGGVNTQVQ